MAHMLEMQGNQGLMVYSGQVPWHGLGRKVSPDLTPDEMLREAGLDWEVRKRDIYLDDHRTQLKQKALCRSSDNSVLTIVGDTWNPVQNIEAFEFFNDFVLSGNMEMHTAGSLKMGQVVWALAKVKESFSVFGDDQIDSYLLFSNPHQFGKCIDVRFVNTRVVCCNTLTYALKENVLHQVKINHSRQFNGDMVKKALGISNSTLMHFREQALFLGSKRYTKDSLESYYKEIYPSPDKEDLSRTAKLAIETIETQPGANYAEGTFWQAFNTVTYLSDHIVGRNNDSRLFSSWYGANKDRKIKALDLAIKYANAA